MPIVFVSCALLIYINFLSLRIMSANRAYINGESHYSKGQKDAVRHLIAYLYNGYEREWQSFYEEINVPLGDNIARKALLAHQPDSIARMGLTMGRNHKDDLGDIIWLFKNFKWVPFVAKAIHEWQLADTSITQLQMVAGELHARRQQTKALDSTEQHAFFERITALGQELTIRANNFSNVLGEGSRQSKQILLYANIFFILIIIGSVSSYYVSTLNNLTRSKNEIESKNKELLHTNSELDRFVYSVSHDLRSPITSLRGLIGITHRETNLDQIKANLQLMNQSLIRQDEFISEILDYSRNKRQEIHIQPVNIERLVSEVIAMHQHIEEAKKISFNIEMPVTEIDADRARLKIILSNVVSNAIKYSDPKKTHRFITIKSFDKEETHHISVEDNGIGISKEDLPQVFDMFFVTNSNKGSGLGLYIAKEVIQVLNGSIAVESEIGVGTTFTISLPQRYV